MRLTKIIATLGPAVEQKHILKSILSTANVVRLNFSHGTFAYHGKFINRVRQLSPHTGILLDVPGPSIRLPLLNKPIPVKKNHTIIFGTRTNPARLTFALSQKRFAADVRKGDLVLVDDGKIRIRITRTTENSATGTVLNDGILHSRKSIVVQGRAMTLPALSPQDKAAIRYGITKHVDWIALSLVQHASTVATVKRLLMRAGSHAGVIAKIEHPLAVQRARDIISAADAVMIARGDLGLTMPVEKVPEIQKKLIFLAQKLGKPVIVATQMLESMVSSQRPTRAEASDVANAVIDGTDAVMLSEETAIGQYPVQTVHTMHRIIANAERFPVQQNTYPCTTIPQAVARSAAQTAQCINATAIITPTRTGFTPFLLASHRLPIPVLAVCDNDHLIRHVSLARGVTGYRGPHRKGVGTALKQALQRNIIRPTDRIVIVYKNELLGVRTANTMEVRVVQECM